MADQAVAAKRAAEGERISELRRKLEIEDSIDTPIASLRDRIYSSLRGISVQLGIWADAFPDRPAPTDGVLAEVRTAEDLILGVESLNHMEAGTFGPEEIDLATEPVGETVDGRLVFGKVAEDWALDALSEKAGGILEEGGHFSKGDLGERVTQVEVAYAKAGPYVRAMGQIFDKGIEDFEAAKTLYYCLRELIDLHEADTGAEHRGALAARAAGEDQLATERQEVAEENAGKALFAARMYEAVEKFWLDLKDAADSPSDRDDDFAGYWSDDPEIASVEKEGVIELAEIGRKYAVKLACSSEWRKTFIRVGALDSTRRIAELDKRLNGDPAGGKEEADLDG